MDPEIFINQKILKPYIPTAEPMAAVFYVTRKLMKFDIHTILDREIHRAQEQFQEKLKSGITYNCIEESKINFAIPTNLFHCLLNNTHPGRISFEKRLDLMVRSYKKIMRKNISFYNREIIRENFINGIRETMLLVYTLNYRTYEKDKPFCLKEFSLPIPQSTSNNNKLDIAIDIIKEKGSDKRSDNWNEKSIKFWFVDKTLYSAVKDEMKRLKVINKNGKLIEGNKKKLNLLILELNDKGIIDLEEMSNKVIVETLKAEFGDSSNDKFFSAIKNQFNDDPNSLNTSSKRFLEKVNLENL
mgnify:CR=1 FL=1